MMEAIQGVIAPNLTPFENNLEIAKDLFVSHAARLLQEGCSGLAPFGTTGEALSLGIHERLIALECLVNAGIRPTQLIPGTGMTSLPDTAELCRQAVKLGCAGVMVLPPFYYKDVTDQGLFAYFDSLISRIADDRLRIYLYHIPPVTRVGLSVALVGRLISAFPKVIVGIKDSSGDFQNTATLIGTFSNLIVYPGNELDIVAASRLGAPGCITATANVNARAIRTAYEHRLAEDADRQQERLRAYRKPINGLGTIPAMKALLALSSGDARWQNVRPPLRPIDTAAAQALASTLRPER